MQRKLQAVSQMLAHNADVDFFFMTFHTYLFIYDYEVLNLFVSAKDAVIFLIQYFRLLCGDW